MTIITIQQVNTLSTLLNTNNTYAQSVYTLANTANGLAQSALTIANSSANTVATFANGTIVLPNANINFNNTATINVTATANGTIQSNVAFTANIYQLAINIGPMVNPSWYALYSGV